MYSCVQPALKFRFFFSSSFSISMVLVESIIVRPPSYILVSINNEILIDKKLSTSEMGPDCCLLTEGKFLIVFLNSILPKSIHLIYFFFGLPKSLQTSPTQA